MSRAWLKSWQYFENERIGTMEKRMSPNVVEEIPLSNTEVISSFS